MFDSLEDFVTSALATVVFVAASPVLVPLAVAGAVVETVAESWDDVVTFFKQSLQKAKQAIKGVFSKTRTFIKKCGAKIRMKIIHYFTGENGETLKQESQVEVPKSKVPPDILAREEEEKETEVTLEMEYYT